MDPFHFFSLGYSTFRRFGFLMALRLFVWPSAVGCHLVQSFICSTKCGLADLVHIGDREPGMGNGEWENENGKLKREVRNEKMVRSVVIIKNPFLKSRGQKILFPTFRTLNCFMTRYIVRTHWRCKIAEVYCHYRKVMILCGMETSGNTRHDYEENGRGAVGFEF